MSEGVLMDKIEVQIISAAWCKRCHTVKPEVAKFCSMTGATFAVVDYEEMDASDQEKIKSLPTIRMRAAATNEWATYTADTLEAWKTALIKLAPTDTDF